MLDSHTVRRHSREIQEKSTRAVILQPQTLHETLPDFSRQCPTNRPLELLDLTRPSPPVLIGTIENQAAFSQNILWHGEPETYIKLCLRKPGGDYYLPDYLAHLAPAIQRIIDVEHATHPRIDHRYCLMTFSQKPVTSIENAIAPTAHIDTSPRAFYEEGQYVERNYVVSDSLPTGYYNRSVTGSVPSEWDRIEHFIRDMQAAFSTIQAESTPEPAAADYQIACLDGTSLHISTAPKGEIGAFRTFLSLVFTEDKNRMAYWENANRFIPKEPETRVTPRTTPSTNPVMGM